MKITFLILAHKNPEQLQRLMNALDDSEVTFVIHVDLKTPILPFKEISVKNCDNIYFLTERHYSPWGHFGLVEATLSGLKFISENCISERVVLISGQDYPIKPIRQIKEYFSNHKDTIFLEHFMLPNPNWYGGGSFRFFGYEYVSQIMEIYGGSQWFSIPSSTINVVFTFLNLNPDFLNYFRRYVKIPDESFFQTLFMNCHVEEKDCIVNSNHHLIKWDNNGWHPEIFTSQSASIDLFLRSDHLFARKFESPQSNSLLDLIDQYLLIQ